MTERAMLYRYELKKILGRKLVWIAAGVMLAVVVFTLAIPLLGGYYVDGAKVDDNYHMHLVDSAHQKALSGRAIDQALLEETMAAYAMVPRDVPRYSVTQEYQTYARPYSAIFNLIRQTTGMDTPQALDWVPDEAALYAGRQAMLERLWEGDLLSQGERDFWRQREAKVEKPLVFSTYTGYEMLIDSLYTIGLLTLLVVAVCLSSVFSDEHARGTDQLILSSRAGKSGLYWSKLWAGTTCAAGLGLFFAVVSFAVSFALYGAQGFKAPFQLMYARSADPICIGQAALISYGLMVLAAALTGVFAMILSELLDSNISALSVVVGLILLSLFITVPEQYRALSQLWDFLPSNFLAVWSIFSARTVPLFGRYLTAWQAAPLLYIALGALLAVAGKAVYRRYQVNGR